MATQSQKQKISYSMKRHKSLNRDFIPFQDAVVLFNTTPTTMSKWRNKYPKCFDVINPKNVNVNVELLNKELSRAFKLTEAELELFRKGE